MNHIAVAILNYNGRHHLEQFLPSVVAHSAGADVVVIDNGSTDDSLQWLRSHYPEVITLPLEQNFGFCGGYNRALQMLTHELVVLLNSDVEVTPGWLEPLAAQFNKHHRLAACQPKILSYHQKKMFEYAGAAGGYIDWLGYPFCRGRLFNTLEADHGQYNDACKIFWASGACMMVRRSAFIEAGGFEELFFAHMEEIDLCWRFHHMGYDVAYQPSSIVYHLGAGTLSKNNPRKTFLNFRNGLCLLLRNYTGNGLFLVIFWRLLLDGLAGFMFLLKGEWANVWAIVRAHVAFYRWTGVMLTARKIILKKRVEGAVYPIYQGSIVLHYYLFNKRVYSRLPRRLLKDLQQQLPQPQA